MDDSQPGESENPKRRERERGKREEREKKEKTKKKKKRSKKRRTSETLGPEASERHPDLRPLNYSHCVIISTTKRERHQFVEPQSHLVDQFFFPG